MSASEKSPTFSSMSQNLQKISKKIGEIFLPGRPWKFRKNLTNSKNPSRYSEKIWKIRALLEKSQIFSFFYLRYVRVLFTNQRKSEKWWRKRWEFKKGIGEKFRKTAENECFGKISLFLINVPKPTENFEECLRNIFTRAALRLFLFL